MNRTFPSPLILLALIALSGASPGIAEPAAELSEPEENFEHLWRTFDRNYALFGAKKVDWDALYALYRPQVTAETTGDELFEIMSNLLAHLNDNHVRLTAGERRFQSGILGEMEMKDFSLDLVKEKYLGNDFETRVRDVFTYGWLSQQIGYFHFRGFGALARSTAAIDEIIETFHNARGIVVDVRANGGGDDRVGKAIADRFADRRRLYMTTRTRNGPEHDDFDARKYWYVEPDGPRRFTRPVILLTHRFSVSAAENFALAMRVIPHVTVAGDATSGVFADVYGDVLPNGWRFSVSYKLFEDYRGFCWEGIGVPADLRQTNSPLDIDDKRDRVLEFAIGLIESGSLGLQDESGSLVDPRRSLVQALSESIASGVSEQAVAEFRRRKSAEPDAWYVDEDEFRELWEDLYGDERLADAGAVAALWAAELAGSIAAHRRLGDTWAERGDRDKARASWLEARRLNRLSFPWERQAAAEIDSLLAGKKILASALQRAGRHGGFDQLVAAYNQHPDGFHVDEGVLNGLGYRFLSSDQVDEAIAVFEINVRAFPESWNVYDSLAEGYMVRGDGQLAIEYYEKSLAVNPDNANGVAMLERLRADSGSAGEAGRSSASSGG